MTRLELDQFFSSFFFSFLFSSILVVSFTSCSRLIYQTHLTDALSVMAAWPIRSVQMAELTCHCSSPQARVLSSPSAVQHSRQHRSESPSLSPSPSASVSQIIIILILVLIILITIFYGQSSRWMVSFLLSPAPFCPTHRSSPSPNPPTGPWTNDRPVESTH